VGLLLGKRSPPALLCLQTLGRPLNDLQKRPEQRGRARGGCNMQHEVRNLVLLIQSLAVSLAEAF
jgi:hypothetical protein